MTIFYIGLNPRWQQYTWMDKQINCMFSAGGAWNGKEFRRRKFFTTGLKFLDSGGFTLLNRFGEFPFGPIEYMNLVAYLRPDYFASMDYPCEPDISRALGLMTNHQRIISTVDNAERLAEWSGHVKSIMIPVIQGYTIDEYIYCLDEYSRRGLITDYMAVGSMCRRIDNHQLILLITGISNYAKSLGCTRLHYFGLKLSLALQGLSKIIYSQDSAVALDAYDSELVHMRGGRRWPRGQKEKELAFNSFLDRITGAGYDVFDKGFMRR